MPPQKLNPNISRRESAGFGAHEAYRQNPGGHEVVSRKVKLQFQLVQFLAIATQATITQYL